MSMDISAAAQPRSDQLNADDLIGGPQLVTITEVRRGNDEQPVNIITKEFGPGRPYKPGKSMLRVLIAAWGKDASTYAGRRLMLYRDPDIRFGKDTVGGIRISAMSHIDTRLTLALTVTRGRRAPFTVDPLPDAPVPKPDAKSLDERIDGMLSAFEGVGVTEAQIAAKLGAPKSDWTADDVAVLGDVFKQVKSGGVDAGDEFPAVS